jgi:hypothetical protein
MFYIHLLACCIQMTSCGSRNIIVFITLSFYLNGCYFCHQSETETECLSKPIEPNRTNYKSLFSTKLYPINVANLSNCCNITLTVMVATQSDVRSSSRHVGTDCVQRFRMLEFLRSFVVLLRHVIAS